ncbi:MAG: AMP-binding protein [Actinobacteria bacterium]|uniref:Uncharacterized protein n=1 Tax=Nostocoides veronense TaxID=330836 RepID=A0ABP4XF93_9MICO|nr:AMP-binding protein [Actinomycetota bacterium]
MNVGVPPHVVVRTFVQRGLVQVQPPHRTVAQLWALKRWGYGLVGSIRSAATVSGSQIALVDESRSLTYADVVTLGERLAGVLVERGIGPGTVVGLLAPNGVDFVLACFAAESLGCDVVLVNAGFTPEQVTRTIQRYAVTALLVDPDLASLATGAPVTHDLGELIGAAEGQAYPPARPPARTGRAIVLTSGTTGTPKGAPRRPPVGASTLVTMIERIPMRRGERVFLGAPLFHTWGLAALQLAIGLRATIVLRRRAEPSATLALLAQERIRTWISVPVIVDRVLLARRATPTALPDLELIVVSGSALRPGLSTEVLDAFGPVLYSVYGSTEASWATIATPADFRADPATAGRPPVGTRVVVADSAGRPVPEGVEGRVLVGNEMLFEGYLGVGRPEMQDGLLDTGDLGFWRDGRLRVTGRADQMIVSGGENVYPQELEFALHALPGVREAAAVGVPDDTFGARLVAYVVPAPGASLTPAGIQRALRSAVARHVRPREVYVVPDLPRNATGKIDLTALRAR